VFVDEQFTPFEDQWAFLASIQRIESNAVEFIAREAARNRTVVGARFVDVDGDETAEPWRLTPSGQIPITLNIDGLPPTVTGVLAQRLFIEKEPAIAATE
jgi:hypothetical protein